MMLMKRSLNVGVFFGKVNDTLGWACMNALTKSSHRIHAFFSAGAGIAPNSHGRVSRDRVLFTDEVVVAAVSLVGSTSDMVLLMLFWTDAEAPDSSASSLSMTWS